MPADQKWGGGNILPATKDGNSRIDIGQCAARIA
jgi:hypothetical protein